MVLSTNSSVRWANFVKDEASQEEKTRGRTANDFSLRLDSFLIFFSFIPLWMVTDKLLNLWHFFLAPGFFTDNLATRRLSLAGARPLSLSLSPTSSPLLPDTNF